MKLKYYMRGVGTGILFTLFIFVIIIIPNFQLDKESDTGSDTDNGNAVTEAAKDNIADILGNKEDIPAGDNESRPGTSEAVTGTEQDDATGIPTESAGIPGPSGTPGLTNTPEPTGTPDLTNTPGPTKEPDLTEAPESTAEPTPTPAVETEGDSARLIIEKGMSSEQVSALAERLGIVSSWEELNKYLIDNGYADFIMTGDYEIKKGASYKTIAGIITTR